MSMSSLKTGLTPPSPTALRKAQTIAKHSKAKSLEHLAWEQVVEELSWKFKKVSLVTFLVNPYLVCLGESFLSNSLLSVPLANNCCGGFQGKPFSNSGTQ